MTRLIAFCRLVAVILARLAAAGLILFATALAAAYVIIHSHFDGTAELPADCALVFGAAVYGQNLPGPAITRRVAAAAALYRDGQVNTLILSGGMGQGRGVSESEASVMRALAIELGVADEDMMLEEGSHSTWENIANARNLTSGCSSVVGVSDQYHLARIELLSWRQGWGELQTVPAQDRPPARSEQRSVLREMFAYVYYALYIDVLFPNLPDRSQAYEFHIDSCESMAMHLCLMIPGGVRCLCERI